MTRRHLINGPDDVIPEALAGFALSYPQLVSYDPEAALVVRRELTPGKVGLVSGGGSGHEPLHAGFVGAGMLDVAVAGAVFASPTALHIHTGTVAADQGAGVLQIVKNYTGDVLNFSIAREIAVDENIAVETVLVDDDVATSSRSASPLPRAPTPVTPTPPSRCPTTWSSSASASTASAERPASRSERRTSSSTSSSNRSSPS